MGVQGTRQKRKVRGGGLESSRTSILQEMHGPKSRSILMGWRGQDLSSLQRLQSPVKSVTVKIKAR